MRHASFSHALFGRNHALLLYETIARLDDPTFTTGDLVRVTEISSPLVSKELGRLVSLELVERLDLRGTYRRLDESPFWPAVSLISTASDE